MIIYEHNLNPIAFKIFDLKIYWYSLSYIFGFLFFIYYSKFQINKKIINLKIEIVDDFVSWAIISIILGGRLGYVFFYNIEFYISNPIEVFKIWKGGMSFHGALLGMIILIVLYSLKRKINFYELTSLVVSSCPVGIFLGRIANFINGELVGIPTQNQWGILYSSSDVPRHPSQIYEAFFEGFILFLILFLFLRSSLNKNFACFSIFLIFYGIFRFFLEYFREPDVHIGYIAGNLSMGQVLSIPMIIFGFIFLKKWTKTVN